MQKNWYINQSGKNKGPFNAQDIIDFYDKGLIKSYQLCWRKGAKSWKPVFAVIQVARDEAIGHYEDQVLNQDTQLPEIPIYEAVAEEQEVSDDVAIEAAQLEVALEETSEDDENLAAMPSKFPIYTTVLASFFIAIVLIISFYFVAATNFDEVSIKNVSIASLNEIKKSVVSNDVTLVANKDMSAVYAKLPFKKRVSVELLLHRQPDALNRDDIMIKAHNIGEGGVIEFKDLVFEEGQSFIPGSYNVTVIYEFLGLLDNIKNKIGVATAREVVEKKVFLVPNSRQEYIEKVSKVQKVRSENSKRNLATINEKLRTLESMISSMSIHYRLSLSQLSGWLAHKEFKERYSKNIAPLLQSIILSNYDLDKKKLSPQELKLENQVATLGKDISAWSVKLTEKLSRYGNLNQTKRLFLRKFMDEDRVVFQSSKNEIQKEIDSLL